MMRSLFSGVAGLKTHQTKMDVIGNNIANVNTIGFKSSAVTFQDIMYQTSSGASGATETLGGVNAKQTGLGVTTAATKISIEQGGAAQSTGEAFDLRFTDMSSTNFFVVSNGTDRLFTRAGSFYIDGAGNLAMTSTGYMVMGWQFDETTGSIRRDTVSPLRVMAPENRTSTPEATTDMYVSGVLDKNDPDVVSEKGFINSLTIYDNLGYEYTVRFSTKLYDGDAQQYTVALDSIMDSSGRNILDEYKTMNGGEASLANIFGSADGKEKSTYEIKSPTKFPMSGTNVTYKAGGAGYVMDLQNGAPQISPDADGDQAILFRLDDPNAPAGAAATVQVKLSTLYGIDNTAYNDITANGGTFTITNGKLEVEKDAINFQLNFDASTGISNGIQDVGQKPTLNLIELGRSLGIDAFTEDVTIDFTAVLAYDNGGTSTMGMDRGQLDNITLGAGRALGALTGLSVSQDGTIWGSYDNGTNRCLGQIPVARFANSSGLESLGNNCYQQTRNSGEFDGIGVDVTADGGQINSGQLEMSNVDLSAEFTDMITTQRGFQANSRIITVSDTMLEELTNLKR